MSLRHFLTVGFLDRAAIERRELMVLRRLPAELVELIEEHRGQLGTELAIDEGVVRMPWFRPQRVRSAEVIALEALRLGCVVADVEHARIVAAQELGSVDAGRR